MFRSEIINYYNLVMSRESTWDILNELGELGALHFEDMDSEVAVFARPFYKQVKRCEELLQKIDNIINQLAQFDQKVQKTHDYKEVLNLLKQKMEQRHKDQKTYFDDVENEIEEYFQKLQSSNLKYEEYQQQFKRLIENKYVISQSQALIQPQMNKMQDLESGYQKFEDQQIGSKVQYIVGSVESQYVERLGRICFRVAKGNIIMQFADLKYEKEDLLFDQQDQKQSIELESQKQLFIIFYFGSQGQTIKQKLEKVCDSLGALRFNIPANQMQLNQQLADIDNQLQSTKNVITLTKNSIYQLSESLVDQQQAKGLCSYIEFLRLFVLKEKQIYITMNMLKLENAIYYGRCWCPEELESVVIDTLQTLTQKYPNITGGQLQPSNIPPKKSPPTYIKLNEFTSVFQQIVNTYGVPRYREINPGLFTCATFPFLFGVMFGDIAHGLLFFIFGLYLLTNAEKLKKSDSMFADIVPFRYLITLMGFFAFYCGFIYNDMTSISLDVFGSCYEPAQLVNGTVTPVRKNDCVYPFGIDPIWSLSSNNLTFYNGYKMKLAVILGVTQMLFGIFLKGLNAIHFKKPLDFIFEFIPQVIFMSALFGYMNFLIISKWLNNWVNGKGPSLISTLMNIALKMGEADSITYTDKSGKSVTQIAPVYGELDGSTQKSISLTFLVIALLMVPIILLPKPLILISQNKSKKHEQSNENSDQDDPKCKLLQKNQHDEDMLQDLQNVRQINLDQKDNLHNKNEQSVDHEEHDAGDIFVHQVIETIEFVLGSISNTASYLRLWALSLAHSQLAEVFFSKALKESGFDSESGIGLKIAIIFVGYSVFAVITLGVLLLMDAMECFLHALRLHWVEFQNKFYRADGYQFEALDFENYLREKSQ